MIDLKGMLASLDVPEAAVSNDTLKIRCLVKDPKSIDIMVSEEIGDDGWGGGVSADEIGATLAKSPTADVNVRINSPGGLAYDGLQIFNMLSAHEGTVTTINEGLAFSAASVIFMAGDVRKTYARADFGIHRAAGGGFGNQFMMMAVAEVLDGLDNHMIELYSERSGNTSKQVTEWIDGQTSGQMGTMFSGQTAVDAGFAHEVINTNAAAKAPLSPAARNESLRSMIAARKAIVETLNV